jgi:hypothetical protein
MKEATRSRQAETSGPGPSRHSALPHVLGRERGKADIASSGSRRQIRSAPECRDRVACSLKLGILLAFRPRLDVRCSWSIGLQAPRMIHSLLWNVEPPTA